MFERNVIFITKSGDRFKDNNKVSAASDLIGACTTCQSSELSVDIITFTVTSSSSRPIEAVKSEIFNLNSRSK